MFTKLSNPQYLGTPTEEAIIRSLDQALTETHWFYVALEKAYLACKHYSIKHDGGHLYLFFRYTEDLSTAEAVKDTINRNIKEECKYGILPALTVSCSLFVNQLLVKIPLGDNVAPTQLLLIPTFIPLPKTRVKVASSYVDIAGVTNAVKLRVSKVKKTTKRSTAVTVSDNTPIRSIPVEHSHCSI